MSPEDVTSTDGAELLAELERFVVEHEVARQIGAELHELLVDVVDRWVVERGREHLESLRTVQGEPSIVTMALAFALEAISDRLVEVVLR